MDIKELTNNIGCMSKPQIEDFASMVLSKCGYPHQMKWTNAGNILIGNPPEITSSSLSFKYSILSSFNPIIEPLI